LNFNPLSSSPGRSAHKKFAFGPIRACILPLLLLNCFKLKLARFGSHRFGGLENEVYLLQFGGVTSVSLF
jgi:hypothetical protein